MFTVSAFALMYRVVAADLRGRAAGLIQGGFLLGGIAGPAVGGLLAEVSLRAPFFV
jgi:MFS family permease